MSAGENGRILMALVVGAICGILLHGWLTGCGRGVAERECAERDTASYIDTLRDASPEVAQERESGSVVRCLAVSTGKGGSPGSPTHAVRAGADSADTAPALHAAAEAGGAGLTVPDSVDVEIPITQREYAGEGYRAWVSGYEARLDSIDVYARRDVVTVQAQPKQKRWHIGPCVGVGYTPRGVAPYVGLSLTYSILSF